MRGGYKADYDQAARAASVLRAENAQLRVETERLKAEVKCLNAELQELRTGASPILIERAKKRGREAAAALLDQAQSQASKAST
jgi:cell division protein FtsB